MLVTDPPPQRLHKQDFIELIERAKRNRPHSHKPPSSRDRDLTEGPGVSELMGAIVVD